jgi:hypothetical protein
MKARLTITLLLFASFQLLEGAPTKGNEDSSRAPSPDTSRGGSIEFNRDIRPILSKHCFACHGPDSNKRKADLRFDIEEGAFVELDTGIFSIVRGDPENSLALELVMAEDEDDRMPPEKTGKRLSAEEIDLFRRWISQGAQWQPHWSYLPPKKVPLPVTHPKFKPSNPIDHFVGVRLQQEKLKPAKEADQVTLARRLSLDLLGLPPSSEEVAAFKADRSAEAYEQLVDGWLASPHFGERMAIHWLDLVRYGDTDGYHGDQHRNVYLFRDYVIRSFNDNKPFDRFTIEQVAGDLIPEASLEQKVASGYNRMLMTTREGGAQPKEYRAKYSADRVRNASTVWLGSTMGCSECHDHKYDPFTAKDFYRFAAFFADVKETAVGAQAPFLVPTPEEQEKLTKLEQQEKLRKDELEVETPALNAAFTTWQFVSTQWEPLRPALLTSKNGAQFKVLEDDSVLVTGTNSQNETYTITIQTELQGITAFRLEVLPDPSLPENGPGRGEDGNFLLGEFELAVAGKTLEWKAASASHSQAKQGVGYLIDKKYNTAWGILDEVGKTNTAVLELKQSIVSAGPQLTLTFNLQQDSASTDTLGRFRLSATTERFPVPAEFPNEIQAIRALSALDRSEEQQKKLADYFRGQTDLLVPQRMKLAETRKALGELKGKMVKTLVTESIEPRMVRVLPRGNWLDDSGPEVQPGVPGFLATLETRDERATRMDLAQWLVAPDNPLVARVFVNRVWKMFFGQGIVTTLDDFGAKGAAPSHPELLDWLATEFRDSGWDVKKLVKLIVMSSTYRQSSESSSRLRQMDPYNALLARQGRFRLDAEMVRDNALAISGLLTDQVGGPSVKPYQPAGYWGLLNFPKRTYQHDKSANLYRRGVYTYWARTFPHPSLLAFDAPSREECTAERVRSNTPQQALVLLNDPIYLEAARVFAQRILTDGGSDAKGRVQYAFDQALNRRATRKEVKLLAQIARHHQQEYEDDPTAADELLNIGESKPPRSLDRAELAAWSSVARVVLNLHETITRN